MISKNIFTIILGTIIFCLFFFSQNSSVVSSVLRDTPDRQQKQKPEKTPVYDETADAEKEIAVALAHAKKENKRVLIQWGANWCGWCTKLHDLYKTDKQISRKLLYEYDVVYVDIGKWDKNKELAEKYNAYLAMEKDGVPYLTILNSDGIVVSNHDTGSLEKGKEHDPEKVLAYLTEHEATYLAAEGILNDGLKLANNTGRKVFLHFGAPWCGWCKRLEAWMVKDKIAAILAKDYVPVKIDVERTVGGKEMVERFPDAKSAGIPWSAILDKEGKNIANSGARGKNFGFPASDEEISNFAALLKNTANKISDTDINDIKESLVEAREAAKK